MQSPETQYNLSYTEYWQARSGLTFGIERILFQERSEFQDVAVYKSDAFGNVLTLDGVVQLTEFDEFVYHEMIAHPALSVLGDAKHVLIIGGGDGGTAREVLKHTSIKQLDLVDIDGMVIDVAKKYFKGLSSSFTDSRLNLHVADGLTFIKDAPAGFYDFIIVDSTDPIGISEGLFGAEFYADCVRALNDRGMMAVQSESPFDPLNQHVPREVKRFFRELFPIAETYLAFIPTYPMGMWSFTFGSKQLHPVNDFNDAMTRNITGDLQYYSADIHKAAFVLPEFVKKLLKP